LVAQSESRFDDRAAFGRSAICEFAAERLDALAHAREPHPGACFGPYAPAVVDNADSKPRERRIAWRDAEHRGLIAQLRLDVMRAGVTKRVGQRLLNETIDGQAGSRAKLSDPRRSG